MVPLVVMILISASFMSLFFYQLSLIEEPRAIEIDGDFHDWSGVTGCSDSGHLVGFTIEIHDYAIDDRDPYLSFYLSVWGLILEGEPNGEGRVDTVYIFIDTDQDPGTGYFIRGIGADYMLEIYGRNHEVMGSSYHSYTSAEQDWNWVTSGSVDVACDMDQMEIGLPWEAISVDPAVDTMAVLFSVADWRGDSIDISDAVIVGPSR